jgi:hypothetical protein
VLHYTFGKDGLPGVLMIYIYRLRAYLSKSVSHSIIFFSHKKSVLASTATIEKISQTVVLELERIKTVSQFPVPRDVMMRRIMYYCYY